MLSRGRRTAHAHAAGGVSAARRSRRTPSLLLAAVCTVALLARSAAAQQPSPVVGSFTAGPLQLAFDSASGWTVSMSGQLAVEGRYELRGDTLLLRDRGGPRACAPDVVGRYTFVRGERTLTLKPAGDACAGRQGALVREWLQPSSGLQGLTGLALIDGTGAGARPGTTLLIENGRIRDVFPDGTRPLPAGTERIDLAGRFVIPGLIDTHVHVATDPAGEDARARTLPRLRSALYGGVTSVRDMGGDARVLADLARAAATGEIESPAIVYGAIFAGPDFFTDRRVLAASRGFPPGEAPWARAVRAQTDLRLAVAEAKGAGARALKLYAALPAPAAARLVREAHAQGLMVWSHATLFPAKPSELVDAGVEVLSHAALLVGAQLATVPEWRRRSRPPDYAKVPTTSAPLDQVLRRMAARGTILDATLFVSYGEGGNLPTGHWAARVTARARELGVRVCAGTDDLIGDDPQALPNLHTELAMLVDSAGLTPLQAIASATSVAAAALGVQQDRGVLAPGKAADVVILERDPTRDIRNTRAIVWVMKNGRRYERPHT